MALCFLLREPQETLVFGDFLGFGRKYWFSFMFVVLGPPRNLGFFWDFLEIWDFSGIFLGYKGILTVSLLGGPRRVLGCVRDAFWALLGPAGGFLNFLDRSPSFWDNSWEIWDFSGIFLGSSRIPLIFLGFFWDLSGNLGFFWESGTFLGFFWDLEGNLGFPLCLPFWGLPEIWDFSGISLEIWDFSGNLGFFWDFSGM